MTSHAPGVGRGRGQNLGLRDFCHILTLLPPGASVFHKHMSSFFFTFYVFHIWITSFFCRGGRYFIIIFFFNVSRPFDCIAWKKTTDNITRKGSIQPLHFFMGRVCFLHYITFSMNSQKIILIPFECCEEIY